MKRAAMTARTEHGEPKRQLQPRPPKESKMSLEVAPNAMRLRFRWPAALRRRKHSVQSERREQQRKQRERAQQRVFCDGADNWRATMSSTV